MKEIYKFVFYILGVILLMVPINCLHLSLRQGDLAAPTTEDSHFAAQRPNELVSDLPESKILDALNLDVGRYSTVSYRYENEQWMHPTKLDQCYDDYTKCLTSLAAPMPVCLVYTNWVLSFFRIFPTYCDGYLENCRIGFRYWRTVAYGRCYLAMPYLAPYTDDI